MEEVRHGTIELEGESVDVAKMGLCGDEIVLQIGGYGRHQGKSMRRNRNPFRAYRGMDLVQLEKVEVGLVV